MCIPSEGGAWGSHGGRPPGPPQPTQAAPWPTLPQGIAPTRSDRAQDARKTKINKVKASMVLPRKFHQQSRLLPLLPRSYQPFAFVKKRNLETPIIKSTYDKSSA